MLPLLTVSQYFYYFSPFNQLTALGGPENHSSEHMLPTATAQNVSTADGQPGNISPANEQPENTGIADGHPGNPSTPNNASTGRQPTNSDNRAGRNRVRRPATRSATRCALGVIRTPTLTHARRGPVPLIEMESDSE